MEVKFIFFLSSCSIVFIKLVYSHDEAKIREVEDYLTVRIFSGKKVKAVLNKVSTAWWAKKPQKTVKAEQISRVTADIIFINWKYL